MNSPRLSWYRRVPRLTQRSRRMAVLAAFAGFPCQLAGYAVLVEPGRIGSLIWAAVSVVLFTATIVGVLAIYGYGQGRIDRRRGLDERQRGMVDRAMIVSYGVLTTVIVAIAGIVAIHASFIGPITIEMTAFAPWIVAIGLYIPFLPFAALAWLEPDAPPDDEV
jgi:hypothetical protein